MRAHIWVAEDTPALNEFYTLTLSREGFDVLPLKSTADILCHLDQNHPCDLLILDVHLPDGNGIDLLDVLKTRGFNVPVLMMTGYGSIALAVRAMQAGAQDFLVKPFTPEKLVIATHLALKGQGISSKSVTPALPEIKPGPLSTIPSAKPFIGTSLPMQAVYEVIENAARSHASVFITGESGTGKDIAARTLHNLSSRAAHPFIALNCAAIPRDLMESELFGHVKGAFTGATQDRTGAVKQAQGGTLFLDEICDMDITLQPKLLRFLQDYTFRPVGATSEYTSPLRVICASNKDPLAAVEKGTLREDLYYRLHVIPLRMPPLRERGEDVLDLADYFLSRFAQEEGKSFSGFDAACEDILRGHLWPGNVRQLMNVIRHIAVMRSGGKITPSMLPPDILGKDHSPFSDIPLSPQGITPLWLTERKAIEAAITATGGNLPRAAALLQVSPSTLYRKRAGWSDRV